MDALLSSTSKSTYVVFVKLPLVKRRDLAWQDLLAMKIRVCLFQFCDAAEVGNHPYEALVKFGSIQI